MRRTAALLALCFLSAPVFAAMQSKPVEWKIGDDTFSGVLVYNDVNAIKRPGLVMMPNWMGVSKMAIEEAKLIAGDDYVVLVADVYGKGNQPGNADQAKTLVGNVYADGGVSVRARADAALQALKQQVDTAPLDASRIGAFGYCFGGGVALELARSGSDLAGVVSLHGDLETYLPAKDNKVLASILVLNGADDASVTDAHIAAFEKEMDAAGADWQFVDFSGAMHCFTDRTKLTPAPNCAYDERTTKRAYEMLHDFFRERFATEKSV